VRKNFEGQKTPKEPGLRKIENPQKKVHPQRVCHSGGGQTQRGGKKEGKTAKGGGSAGRYWNLQSHADVKSEVQLQAWGASRNNKSLGTRALRGVGAV